MFNPISSDALWHFVRWLFVEIKPSHTRLSGPGDPRAEGFTKALRRFDSRIQVPDYSTIDRRVNRSEVKVDEEDYGDDIVLAVDASGIKGSNRGDWMRRKWKMRRGYLNIHVAVDVKRKRIPALEVTDEKVNDTRMLQPLVEDASRKGKIAKTVADGAYETKTNFRCLDGKKIDPVIKLRRDAVGRSRIALSAL